MIAKSNPKSAKPKQKHGGPRPGSGRPKAQLIRPLRDIPAPIAKEVEDLAVIAREYTSIAIMTLAEIALNGIAESSRVAAANSLLDRGYGKPYAAVAEAASEGKKAQRQASADKAASDGRFAVPAPPSRLVS